MSKPYLLMETTYKHVKQERPTLAVLPWGATEAHNQHLPYGTDVIEATMLADLAAARAHQQGAKLVVLPTIPFGNNAQQLDQAATIHLSTSTAAAILRDVALSLQKQGIQRLVILNSHGGNEFKPLIRDLQGETGLFIVQVNFWQMRPELIRQIFSDPGDHAGDLETSMLLHLCPDLVHLKDAGTGARVPFDVAELSQAGVWTPRLWSRSHPDTGAGDPRAATAEKGRAYVEGVCDALAKLLVALAKAPRVP